MFSEGVPSDPSEIASNVKSSVKELNSALNQEVVPRSLMNDDAH